MNWNLKSKLKNKLDINNRFDKQLLFFVKTFIFTIFFLCVSANFNIVNAASVGVSPGAISNENLIPGSSFEQEFIISRGNPDQDIEAGIEIDAEEIADWIEINPGETILLPAGEQRVPFTITITVPKEADYGKYEGYFRVILKNEDKGQVSIQPAIRLDIDLLVVAKEVRLFEVQNAKVLDSFENSDLVVELQIRNNGNVESSPEMVNVDVYSESETLLDSFSSNEIPIIPAFKTEIVQVNIADHKLIPGTYVGQVSVKDSGEILLSDRSIFKIYEGGAIEDLEGDDNKQDSDNIFNRVWEIVSNSIKDSMNNIYSFVLEYKVGLIIGFLFFALFIIFILLMTDREERKDEDS